MARTRPQAWPATMGSPTRSVPLSTSTVATAPRPASRLASRTRPRTGASGPHGGERLVTRCVDEGDLPAVLDRLVGTDVLGDAAGLAGHHVGFPDAVEQLRLAVVDVTHDRHDRRARLEERLVVFVVVV